MVFQEFFSTGKLNFESDFTLPKQLVKTVMDYPEKVHEKWLEEIRKVDYSEIRTRFTNGIRKLVLQLGFVFGIGVSLIAYVCYRMCRRKNAIHVKMNTL